MYGIDSVAKFTAESIAIESASNSLVWNRAATKFNRSNFNQTSKSRVLEVELTPIK
jgi:hypothetical protein